MATQACRHLPSLLPSRPAAPSPRSADARAVIKERELFAGGLGGPSIKAGGAWSAALRPPHAAACLHKGWPPCPAGAA